MTGPSSRTRTLAVTLSVLLVGASAALEKARRACLFPKQGPEPSAGAPEQEREGGVAGPWDLAATGRIATLIFAPPEEEGAVAKDTVVFWEFRADKRRLAFRPREYIKADARAPDRFLLVDVKREAPGVSRFRILYDVFDDPNDGSRPRRAELLHDAAPKRNPDDPFGFGPGGCVLPLPSGR